MIRRKERIEAEIMTLTHYGIREWGGAGLIAVAVLIGAWLLGRHVNLYAGIAVAVLVLLVYFALAFFFRNPHRTCPPNPEFILSPADGTVKDIGVAEDFNQEPFTGRACRVGIFLSVLNVHLNRAPADWKVISKHYREGRYLDARDARCAKENEAMTLSGTATANGANFPLAVRQISGAIARRIVCPVEPGADIRKGKIYGMIKFGSRTELYLPDDGRFEIKVKPGDRVQAGVTVIAVVRPDTATREARHE